MDMNVEVAINPNLDISKFGRRLEQALKLSAFKVEEGAKQNIMGNWRYVQRCSSFTYYTAFDMASGFRDGVFSVC